MNSLKTEAWVEIRQYISLGDRHTADAEKEYREAGRLLIVMKSTIAHGDWLPTLEREKIHPRLAQRLMELSKSDVDVVFTDVCNPEPGPIRSPSTHCIHGNWAANCQECCKHGRTQHTCISCNDQPSSIGSKPPKLKFIEKKEQQQETIYKRIVRLLNEMRRVNRGLGEIAEFVTEAEKSGHGSLMADGNVRNHIIVSTFITVWTEMDQRYHTIMAGGNVDGGAA